jgi:hypothetical protein
MAQRVTAKQRAEVTRRAHNLCEYCRSPGRFATQAMSVEHIHPRQKGGGNELDNLALSCQGCNGFKAAKTTGVDPFTGRRVPLYHPRRQLWGDHFAWSDDYLRIVGLTPTGRATVLVLRLNRDGVMNLRNALHVNGQHPPQETIDDLDRF